MARVVVFGTGVGADTAYRYLSRDSPHVVSGFAVDAAYLSRREFHGLPVVEYESVTERFPPDEFKMFILMGFQRMNAVRTAKYLDAKSKGYECVSYVSSHHYALEGVTVGENCFILDSQTFNLDVRFGNNIMVWSGNHFGDRSVIGDHSWISSHVTISGDVSVGESCFLGVNACVSNDVQLGPRTFVGAGAVIAKSTAADSVHVAPSSRVVAMSSDRFVGVLKSGGV